MAAATAPNPLLVLARILGILVMIQGTVMLARTRGTPVILMGIAARPTLKLRSWDQTRIPLPFAKGCAVFDGPLQVSRQADAAAVKAMRAEWQTRLCAAQSRAEALLAGR
jgi:lysophospholipid acyltransferase (LPLAT)-like uncharacterized protein